MLVKGRPSGTYRTHFHSNISRWEVNGSFENRRARFSLELLEQGSTNISYLTECKQYFFNTLVSRALDSNQAALLSFQTGLSYPPMKMPAERCRFRLCFQMSCDVWKRQLDWSQMWLDNLQNRAATVFREKVYSAEGLKVWKMKFQQVETTRKKRHVAEAGRGSNVWDLTS